MRKSVYLAAVLLSVFLSVLLGHVAGGYASPEAPTANSNTRIYNETRTVMITQISQGERPTVEYWGAQGDFLQAYGIYGDWTVRVEWPAEEIKPFVFISRHSPPASK